MTALPRSVVDPESSTSETNAAFLRFLPAVRTHAKIRFRHLSRTDREEAVAEATAAAFLNFASAERRGMSHAVTRTTLSDFAVRHVRTGRHVGGSQDRKRDVLSRRAQRHGGFKVHRLGGNREEIFDCMRSPDQPVWRLVLLEDRRTPPPDQAAFRIDWSRFLAGQTDRTRTALAMLAAGNKQLDVADTLGVTPSAVCQRVKRAGREWYAWQADAQP